MGDNTLLANLVAMPNGNRLAELDLMLTADQFDAFYPDTSIKRKKRKAVRNTVYRWPGGTMVYEFGRNKFSNEDIYMIKVAMREWEKYTCVRFQEKRDSDSDYVLFNDGFGCNSQLGMVRGQQLLNLDINGCRWKGLYLHEIGHALGLIHEHQRPNRDQFIRIIQGNVEPSMLQWFNKYPQEQVNPSGADYEYSSVMHYGITAFSRDGSSKTIEALQNAKEKEIGRVYLKELSYMDAKAVNNMYGCTDHCDKTFKICINGGFLDQNCECLCPDGTSNCEQGNIQPSDPSCTNDDDWKCNIWAKQGECSNNAVYMHGNCRKACGICGEGLVESEFTVGQCADLYDNVCEKWKANGDCIVNEEWMSKVCKMTCGLCDSDVSPPGTSCDNSHSSDTQCDEWAHKGECQINPAWMPSNCQKACRTCPIIGNQPTTQRPRATTQRPGATTQRPRATTQRPRATTPRPRATTQRPRVTAPPNTTPTTTPVPRSDDCVNRWPNSDCDVWAKHNHCIINPSFMEINCMLSCEQCPMKNKEPTGDTGDTGNTGNTGYQCKNDDNWDKFCDGWADADHCIINPGWMKTFCIKSCRVCTNALRQVAKRQAMAEGVIYEDGSIANGTNPFGNLGVGTTDRNTGSTSGGSLVGFLLTMALTALLGH